MLRLSPMMRPTLFGLRPQDVFATNLWNAGTTTIPSSLNLAGQGGMVWAKSRPDTYGHSLTDTVRGSSKYLQSDGTGAEISSTDNAVTAFGSTNYTLGQGNLLNAAGSRYVGWSFRRAAKFFDIVTYTGDGTNGRQIPHALGIVPGMIVVKKRDVADDWPVYHRSTPIPGGGNENRLLLNSTQAATLTGANAFGSAVQTSSTTFTVGTAANATGASYVAYLFAHDPDTTNGIIQCGIFTEATNSKVASLPWPGQWLMTKSTSVADDWRIVDTARGANSSTAQYLRPNTPSTEAAQNPFYLGNDGIYQNGNVITAGSTNVYCVIRAPI